MTYSCAILIVAKAPVPGLAKTRLTPEFGRDGAAELAAAALLDTLEAVAAAQASERIVALTGELGMAARGEEIRDMLQTFTVVPQRGNGLAQRLAAAHADAAAIARAPVLQIGMDTPQVSGPMLSAAAKQLANHGPGAILGPATDGGWWALGVSDPEWAVALEGVPMSRPDTGALTRASLDALGVRVGELPELRDVDTAEDVWLVADAVGVGSRFRVTVDELRRDSAA
jgi:hypothetical protein